MRGITSVVLTTGIVTSLISASAASAAASPVPGARHNGSPSASTLKTSRLSLASLAIVDEDNDAVAGTPPSFTSDECITHTGSKACFDKVSDDFWILDSAADGNSARNAWGNWLWDGSNWQYYREGECKNSLGNGHWGVCKKDLYENSSTNALGGKGSLVGINACGATACSDVLTMYNDA